MQWLDSVAASLWLENGPEHAPGNEVAPSKDIIWKRERDGNLYGLIESTILSTSLQRILWRLFEDCFLKEGIIQSNVQMGWNGVWSKYTQT